MTTDALVATFDETTRLDIHEVVRRLNTHLGATVVATLAGSRDSKLPYRWARDTMPNTQADARLRVAHRIWRLISDAESDHVARAWFLGVNPLLDETAPVLAIRADKHRAALQAANAFVTGAWHD